MRKGKLFSIFLVLLLFLLSNPSKIKSAKFNPPQSDKPFKPIKITTEKLTITGAYKPFMPLKITTEKLTITGQETKKKKF